MARSLNRSMRWGSILIAVGAVFWLVQGALLISALPTVSSGFNLNPTTSSNNTSGVAAPPAHQHVWISEYAVSGAAGTFVLATLLSVLAAGLLAVGIILILRRPATATARPGESGPRSVAALSRGTKALGVSAAVLIGAFAALGSLAFTTLLSQSPGSIAANCGAWADGCPITTALELWIVGSGLLLVGGELFAVAFERIAKETHGQVRIHGSLFSNYAIVNFLGLAVVPFAVVMSPSNGGLSDSLLYASLFAQLFVVPITGFIAWSWLSVHGFQSAFRGTGEPEEPEGGNLPSWGRNPAASEEPWGQSPGGPLSGPTSGAIASPRATARAPFLDPDWALRIQTRMQNLERLVIAQNETISDLRGLMTRLPADPDPSGANVSSRIGRVESLSTAADFAPLSSPQVPQSGLETQGSRLPETLRTSRPRAPTGPPDDPNRRT